jgi:SNF2 family DNA or RNA helicase
LVRDAVSRKVGVVATIDSVGTGIDGLQTSISVGIMHALDYVPIKMAQAEGRLDRIGQNLPVTWYYLAMKDSMDSLAIKSIVNKLDATRAIMGQNEAKGLRDSLSDSSSIANSEASLRSLYESL